MPDKAKQESLLPLSRILRTGVKSGASDAEMSRGESLAPPTLPEDGAELDGGSGVELRRDVPPRFSEARDLATLVPPQRLRFDLNQDELAFLHALPAPLLVVSQHFVILTANRTAGEMLGVELSHLRGQSLTRFVHEGQLNRAKEKVLRGTQCARFHQAMLVGLETKELEIQIDAFVYQEEALFAVHLIDRSREHRKRAEYVQHSATTASAFPNHTWDELTGPASDDLPIDSSSALLERAHHFEVLGQLSGEVAHDLANLLTVMRASIDAAQLKLNRASPEGSHADEDLVRAKVAASRSAELVTQVLNYARHRSPRGEVVQPDGLILQLRGLLERALRRGQSLTLTLDFAGQILTNVAELETSLLNLVINSRDAMESEEAEGGEVEISTSFTQIDELEALQWSLRPGPHLRILVKDSGSGFSHAALERACEPFFSTKPEGRGTGLGLSAVRTFCRKWGGGVQLANRPDGGAAISLLLPLHEAHSPSSIL